MYFFLIQLFCVNLFSIKEAVLRIGNCSFADDAFNSVWPYFVSNSLKPGKFAPLKIQVGGTSIFNSLFLLEINLRNYLIVWLLM